MNKEEKKVKKISYEKLQVLQVSRVSMLFKIWSSSALRHVILWSIKTIKIVLKFIFPVCRINFRVQHLTCPFIDHRVTIHHDIFWSFSHASFLTVSSISFWSYIFWSMICCFQSSSRHAIQMEVSEPKIISFYIVMLSLMASSSSSFVFI